jgi:hypothetical protein
MLILSHIYYIFGIIVILSNLSYILKFNKIFSVLEWYTVFKEVTGSKPKFNDFRKKEDYTLFTNRNILSSFEIFWILVGVFTSSWIFFLFIISYIIIANLIFYKIKFSLISKISSFTFAITRISIYSYLIINHFIWSS